jgi:leucyl-tRNA---protein transferase
MTAQRPRLLLGTEHRCSYLAGRLARSVFVDPQLPVDPASYGALLDLGFRRSGAYVYRPACAACTECRPVRIPVTRFRPDRTQRRCLARNADLQTAVETVLSDEHYALYQRYLRARHTGGGMDADDREAFESFLSNPWGQTGILAMRDARGRLLAGAVMDQVPRGLSAVYTYFDPADSARSLGTYAVLQQIDETAKRGLPYLYLGYWVPGSEKMDYKKHFNPFEILAAGGWRTAAGG